MKKPHPLIQPDNKILWVFIVSLAGIALILFLERGGTLSAVPTLGIIAAGIIIIMIDIRERVQQGKASLILPILITGSVIYSVLHGSAMRVANLAGLGLFIIYYLAYSPTEQRMFWRRARYLGWPILAWTGFLFISHALNGTLLQDSLLKTLAQFQGYAFFPWVAAGGYYLCAVLYCRTPQDVWRLLGWMLVWGFFEFIFVLNGLTGILSRIPLLGHFVVRASQTQLGTFNDTELLAEYSIILVVTAAVFSLRTKSWISMIMYWALLAVYTFVGIVSGMRSFWVGGALGIIGIALLFVQSKKITRIILLFILAVLIVISILALAPHWLIGFIQMRIAQTQDNLSTGDIIHRAALYKWSMELSVQMPLWGYGGNEQREFNRFVLSQPGGFQTISSHSLYTFALLTAGYPGLISIGIVVLSAFLYSFQVWRGDKNMRELAAIMMVIAIILALHEAKTEFARSVLAMQYIYTIFGMISSIFALSKGKSELIAHG